MTSRDANEFEPDPLLDSLLDEVLGAQGPPDLKDQILRRLKQQAHNSKTVDRIALPDTSATAAMACNSTDPTADLTNDDGNHVTADVTPLVTHRSAGERLQRAADASRYFPVWMAASLASVLLLVGLLWGLLNLGSDGEQTGPIAQDAAPSVVNPAPPPVQPSTIENGTADSSEGDVGDDQPAADGRSAATSNDVEPVKDQDDSEGPADEQPPARDESTTPVPGTEPARPVRMPREQVLAQVNRQLREIWSEAKVVPAPALRDDEWLDRVCQKLLGRPPRANELRVYSEWPESERRERFLDFVFSPNYGQQLGKHWSTGWANMLLEHASTRSAGLRVYRTGLEQFLAEAITQNYPYDDVVIRLLSADGSNDPARPDYDPAADYLLAMDDGEGSHVLNELCRGFLARRAQCAQCHDDTFGELSQEDYWELAGVFQSLDSETIRVGRARIVDRETPSSVRFRDLTGAWKSTQPTDFAGNDLAAEPGATARHQFAEKLVQLPEFAKAGVNRMWAYYLQYGFTFPVDDMGKHNPTAHPQLVEFLSEQFAAHQFDLRELSRWVLLSEAFNRSDVVTTGVVDDFPENGSVPLFSRAYRRPVLFSEAEKGLAWLSTGRIPQVISSDGESDRQMLNARRYRDLNGEDVFGLTNEDGTIMRMGQLLSIHQVRMIQALTSSSMEQSQQVEHVYQMVLDRKPSAAELEQAQTVYAQTNNNAESALQRIVWALINSRDL